MGETGGGVNLLFLSSVRERERENYGPRRIISNQNSKKSKRRKRKKKKEDSFYFIFSQFLLALAWLRGSFIPHPIYTCADAQMFSLKWFKIFFYIKKKKREKWFQRDSDMIRVTSSNHRMCHFLSRHLLRHDKKGWKEEEAPSIQRNRFRLDSSSPQVAGSRAAAEATGPFK